MVRGRKQTCLTTSQDRYTHKVSRKTVNFEGTSHSLPVCPAALAKTPCPCPFFFFCGGGGMDGARNGGTN